MCEFDLHASSRECALTAAHRGNYPQVLDTQSRAHGQDECGTCEVPARVQSAHQPAGRAQACVRLASLSSRDGRPANSPLCPPRVNIPQHLHYVSPVLFPPLYITLTQLFLLLLCSSFFLCFLFFLYAFFFLFEKRKSSGRRFSKIKPNVNTGRELSIWTRESRSFYAIRANLPLRKHLQGKLGYVGYTERMATGCNLSNNC